MEITLHRALAQIKTTEQRIRSMQRQHLDFVSAVDPKFKEKETKKMKANYDKYNDLVQNYIDLKMQVTLANSGITEDLLGQVKMFDFKGKKYTLAQAMVLQKCIPMLEDFLQEITTSLLATDEKVESYEEDVKKKLDKLVANLKVEDKDNAVWKELEAQIKKNNELAYIDPNKIEEKIQKLQETIDETKVFCDSTLSVANATITINI